MLAKGVTISLLTLPLLLTGCGDKADHVSAPGQQQAASAPRSVKSEYSISNKGVGLIQLGMTSSEILAAFPKALAKTEKDGEGMTWMILTLNDEELMRILLDEYDHAAVLIRVTNPKFVTEQGVRVGENLQSAGEKLGGLTDIQWTEIESREFASFAAQPSNIDFQVEGENGGTAGVYNSDETITTTASPLAHIQSIWLTEDM